ncbi:MAG: hypothetical protein ABW124_13305, partial [Candidatus Thiodiazotropha sp. 6PLUC9]
LVNTIEKALYEVTVCALQKMELFDNSGNRVGVGNQSNLRKLLNIWSEIVLFKVPLIQNKGNFTSGKVIEDEVLVFMMC